MEEEMRAVEPISRILEIYSKMCALGSDIYMVQRKVDDNRKKYYGAPDVERVEAPKETGVLNEISWMFEDMRAMVADIKQYVNSI